MHRYARRMNTNKKNTYLVDMTSRLILYEPLLVKCERSILI